MTVTQASTAFELAPADRDHIASTVYTLVLAYAGSALPILLLFTIAGRSLHDTITSDTIAVCLIRTSHQPEPSPAALGP